MTSASFGEKELLCGSSRAESEHVGNDDLGGRNNNNNEASRIKSIDQLRQDIASDIVTNNNSSFSSPLQTVPLVYCDQTASNRPVRSIEDYVQKVCLPMYGNTHTNISVTGSQTTAFVAEARQIVAESCNAKVTGKASEDVVLFAGNGATSAVELLIDVLGISHATERPVVFVGPYEHHSNLVPWRESGCEIVMIPEDSVTMTVSMQILEKQLKQYTGRLKIGTFSAASNVTGKVSNVDEIAAMLHNYGALAFFDYATGASYLPMDMNPVTSDNTNGDNISKDAIFFSSHKLLGGVGGPGVLVVKKNLVSQVNAPRRSGGGTVFYVTHNHHRFLSDRVERYEGGTPNITGVIRTGLALLLKRQAEEKYRMYVEQQQQHEKNGTGLPRSLADYEMQTFGKVASYLRQHAPNVIILGGDDDTKNARLPIFSFLIRHGKRYLHYNYVCAILNDLFGIQSRGGCQCAGPYSQHLLGLTECNNDNNTIVPNSYNTRVEEALVMHKERAEPLRPGYTRLSLPFKGLCSDEVDYVCKALVWVAKNGWALMCQYRCNHKTGEWRHQSRQGRPLGRSERLWLSHYEIGEKPKNQMSSDECVSLREMLDRTLVQADKILQDAKNDSVNLSQAIRANSADAVLGNNDLEELRWYVYPKECAIDLANGVVESSDMTDQPLMGIVDPFRRLTKSVEMHTANDTSDLQKCDDTVIFRDGQYTGESLLSEVLQGVEDGELSSQCEIFDHESDQWYRYNDFIKVQHCIEKVPDSQQTIVSEETDSMETTDNNIEDIAAKESRKSTTPSIDVSIVANKKSARDNTSWGVGQPVVSQPLESSQADADNTANVSSKRKRFCHQKPPAKLMRTITQAVMQWDMIQSGDKLLLGLSGGKDSLSLLHCLLELRRKLKTKFELEVCTIDPLTPSFDPSPLIEYVKSLGLKYHYIRENIVESAAKAGNDGKMVSSLCAYCARMKRGLLYACARDNKCNKLVLAQHLDDCAESFMMSIMHNGFLRTMKANYKIDAGDLSVIRPMVYCRESLMTDFAKSSNLPVINENCPACFEEPKERARVKKLLSREESMYPTFYDNIKRALLPLMHGDSTDILRSFAEEVLARSRKDTKQNGKVIDTAPVDDRLKEFSDADLLRELARRKALKTDNTTQDATAMDYCIVGGGCTIVE